MMCRSVFSLTTVHGAAIEGHSEFSAYAEKHMKFAERNICFCFSLPSNFFIVYKDVTLFINLTCNVLSVLPLSFAMTVRSE